MECFFFAFCSLRLCHQERSNHPLHSNLSPLCKKRRPRSRSLRKPLPPRNLPSRRTPPRLRHNRKIRPPPRQTSGRSWWPIRRRLYPHKTKYESLTFFIYTITEDFSHSPVVKVYWNGKKTAPGSCHLIGIFFPGWRLFARSADAAQWRAASESGLSWRRVRGSAVSYFARPGERGRCQL